MFPSTAAKTFFDLGNGEALWPPSQNAKVSPPKGLNTPQARTESDDAIQFLVPLLGARDLSIAAALFTLHRQGLYSEVGTVILGGMLLCAADTVAVWKKRGPVWWVLYEEEVLIAGVLSSCLALRGGESSDGACSSGTEWPVESKDNREKYNVLCCTSKNM